MEPARQETDVFAAITAPARRAMLACLAAGEMPVGKLAESFDMSLPAVSQHLAVLRGAGLVKVRREGRNRLYRHEPEHLKAVAEWIKSYESFWVDKLASLGKHLEVAAESSFHSLPPKSPDLGGNETPSQGNEP